MADQKITALNSIVTIAVSDLLAIVDVDATETKNVSVSQLTNYFNDTTILTNFAESVLTTNGDLFTFSGGIEARLPVGAETQVLTVVGGVPTWAAAAGGGGEDNLFTANDDLTANRTHTLNANTFAFQTNGGQFYIESLNADGLSSMFKLENSVQEVLDIRNDGRIGIGKLAEADQLISTNDWSWMTSGDFRFNLTNPVDADAIKIVQEYLTTPAYGRVTFDGTTGGLLVIDDDKDNELFTASDVSGNPIMYCDADWLVELGNPFNRPFRLVYDATGGTTEIFLDLPTSPGTTGSLYNDLGTVKVAP